MKYIGYSEKAHELIRRAREVSVEDGRSNITTEYYLYAMLDHEGSGAYMMLIRYLALNLDDTQILQHGVQQIRQDRSPDEISKANIPILSATEAINRGGSIIETTDMLLALINADKDRAGRILTGIGITLENTRHIARLYSDKLFEGEILDT